jgi:membrane protein YdbS with pleckstrin-like domain
MVTEDPRPGDEPIDDGDRRFRSDYDTQPIPRVRNDDDDVIFDDLHFDDAEFAGLHAQPVDLAIDRTSEPLIDREPSELARRYLFPTEKFRGEWRRHWIHLTRRLLWGVLATFLLGYGSGFLAKHNVTGGLTILVIVWLVVMGWVFWHLIEWYYDRFVLTNKRLMLITGIIARNVGMMPLARVTDMKYTQSPLGRVLGYGTFEIESAGQDQALRKVEDLPNPTDLYLQVVEEMYEPEAAEARRRTPTTNDGT